MDRSVDSMTGVGWWARHPIGWRTRLSVAGAVLGMLPLMHGEWLAAPVAGIGGLAVVGGWAMGTSSGRTVGMAVGTGLLASLTAVFAISQWPRPGRIHAHWFDWFAVWLLIGVGCLAGLAVDWYMHTGDGVVRLGATGVALSARQAVHALAGLITASMVAICCGWLVVPFVLNYDGALHFVPRDSEILPLPPTLRLISAGPCERGGSAPVCTAEFVVTAADRATRAVTVTRLVEHLRRLGWPLQPMHDAYFGCRRTGGILHWTSHCLVLDVHADPTSAQPRTPPEAVIIRISN